MKQLRLTMSMFCVVVALGACGGEPADTDESAMREAINEALARFDAACIHPPLAARGDVFPATVEAAANGGEWLRKMESLEAVGFFTGSPVQVQGRPAKTFRLTERGQGVYRQETSGLGIHTHLFCYGSPEVVEILAYTDQVDMPTGGTMTQVTFTYAVRDAAGWARDSAVREAFAEIDQDLASSQTPQEGQVVLVKTGEGWIDQRLMQQSP